MNVSLRLLEDRGLDTIYQQVTDPELVPPDNGSLRVLEKAGFRLVGVNRDFAPGRGEEIEGTILRLR